MLLTEIPPKVANAEIQLACCFCARVFAGLCSYLFFCKEWFLTQLQYHERQKLSGSCLIWTNASILLMFLAKICDPCAGVPPSMRAHCGGCLARVHGDNIATPPQLIVTRCILFMAARHNQWRQRLLKPGGRVWFQCRSYLYCMPVGNRKTSFMEFHKFV